MILIVRTRRSSERALERGSKSAISAGFSRRVEPPSPSPPAGTMDDVTQNGSPSEQWYSTFDKVEKRQGPLGSGALRFIRTRSSIRRELKRQSNRSKSGDSNGTHEMNNSGSSGGGGSLTKWLREHLGGGSKGNQDVNSAFTSKYCENDNGSDVKEKIMDRTTFASQNLYCSLPREHSRHFYNSVRKTGYTYSQKNQTHERPRSNSVHHHEKSVSDDLGALTRGGPIYGSECKSLKKRNRDRRRLSLNEAHEQGRHRRKRYGFERDLFGDDFYEIGTEDPGYQKIAVHDERIAYDRWEYVGAEGFVGYDRDTFEDRAEEEEEAEVEYYEEPDEYDEIFATKKTEEKQRDFVIDHVLTEIPEEILANRELMIGKINEQLAEYPILQKKNKILERAVARHLKKVTQRKVIPVDTRKHAEDIDKIYSRALFTYKLQLDEIMARRSQLIEEITEYENKVQTMDSNDEKNFLEFLDHAKSVGSQLILTKAGKKFIDNTLRTMTQRQVVRRNLLSRQRYDYVIHWHRLENLTRQLAKLETLGEGMSIMDYEVLRMTNVAYKDRLEDRDRELEKLRTKIRQSTNQLAQFKEKEIGLIEDTKRESEILEEYRARSFEKREKFNDLHLTQKELRATYDEMRMEAGLLVARPELLEMERTMKSLATLKYDIELIKEEIQQREKYDKERKNCVPNGGVSYTMTELQPSPPGYRVQDEAPGPPSCNQGPYKYTSHCHGSDSANFRGAQPYPQESYALKQNASRAMVPNEFCRRRNDSRGPVDNENVVGNDAGNGCKKAAIANYNDGHKKNTPSYKNDSGYSESLGFDSYSLPLDERDEASPPPTPPVRDASSLKGVCYGPGHEKYPSWPSAPERHPDDENHTGHNGSHRSKSWTDHTNYPKEKPAQYTRPYTKRPNPTFTQQLKTVMERCEKIPAETFESRSRNAIEDAPRLWPRVDREGKSLGDAEYVVPSPPEREQQTTQTLSHADLEAYVRSYQDPQSQVDLYRETTLTQAGLEEYTRVQHSQQASYAQSEGYHSYVSSVDSTTNTPFLDRLRRDSEAAAQRPVSTWEETSREGRDSVVTTSSGSASSSETLKWHGSMSDVSVSSGLPARQGPSDRWHHSSMSDVSSVNGGIMVQKSNNCHDKWQSSMSDVSSAGLSPTSKEQHEDKWPEKWQASMNDRNKQGPGRSSLPAVISHCATSTVVNDVCQNVIREGKWQESNIDEDSFANRSNGRQWVNSTENENTDKYKSQSPTRQRESSGTQSPDNWNPLHGSMSDVSQTNGIQCSKQLIAHSARVQTPQRHHSESVLYLDRERSQRKLYPVGTTQSQDISQRLAPTSPSQTQLSVAERINELEKQQLQQMRYTYLDPDKRHRVSDPTLKAIQKKALLSFYERHHQASWRSEPQLAQGVSLAPQSPPPQPPPRPRPPSSRRASSASDYCSGTWRENVMRNQNQTKNDLPSPKHQHSNSCGSLSTDLLGPVIVGPAISIDDWVPERPPKKPHLRNVYNERVPSPDLPPPSPPTVTENEVHESDEPLPPPPPELNDNSISDGLHEVNSINIQMDKSKVNREKACERHKSERSSIRRTKHSKRDVDKSLKNSPPNSVVKKTGLQDPEPSQFVRATTIVKHIESEVLLENGVSAGFATHRMMATGRSSLRYPPTQKLMVNGRVASVRRISEDRPMIAKPPAQLPDLVSQRYSDSGNQRPAPQVPVEPRIIRQESMRVESTRIDASGLLRNDSIQRLESSGQRPQPQVPKTIDRNSPKIQTTRNVPNCLPVPENTMNSSKYVESGNQKFSIGSPVKTGYEANSKMFANECNPQKYHEPPKYVPNYQRHNENQQRNYYALPPKFDPSKQKSQSHCPSDRCAGAGVTNSSPPPLAPRQNTPGRKSLPPPPRPAPPHTAQQGSQSKASYLAYRRERGAPDSEGSYKRTMSPTSRLEDWPPSRDHDDPVLLRVTPHHPQNHLNNQHHELAKSHSVDALHQRIEDRTNHSAEVIGKLSNELSKKLQASETRTRTNENNNNDNHEDRHNHHQEKWHHEKKHDHERRDRHSPQSVEVLNDRNRQLERERRKLAASCEPLPQSRERQMHSMEAPLSPSGDDFFRERSATIEMTSQNIELLNRRNEKKTNATMSAGTHASYTTIAVSTDSHWSIERQSPDSDFSDRPPPPTSSPPKSPDQISTRGAVPRRSGSCSSSSSSGTSTDIRISPRTLPIRGSPKKSLDSPTRIEPRIERITANRKVSSPTQTDSMVFWDRSGSPSQIYTSQITEVNCRSDRHYSPSKSRSSLSSLSSISKASSSSSSSSSPIQDEKSSPVGSSCVSPQPGVEGLTLVQRTEVVLRVNAPTSDAASQTDTLENPERDLGIVCQDQLPEPRKKLPEEIECEELSRDLASQLSPNDKLVPILVPAPEHKKPTDYVSGLFRVEATLQPRPRRRLSLEESTTSSIENGAEDDKKNDSMSSIPATPSSPNSSNPLSPTSAYFTTSEGKARFLTRYSKNVNVEDSTNSEETTSVATVDNINLRQKKEELVMRLDRKLEVLRAEQEAVREEGEVNEALGARVATRISALARPAEASKYRLHVEEVGKITSLLLGLSGRLARAENALYGMPADHAERKILESKRDKLLDQLEEAKILKSNIDKRSVNVSAILAKYLNDEEFIDYQHFINMKAKLIVDGREIQDKVKLGEEQLAALKEAID